METSNAVPLILEDYENYIIAIKGLSKSTAEEYMLDLKVFFKFLKLRYLVVSKDTLFDDIIISDIDLEFLKNVNLQDLHAYISYVDKERLNKSKAKYRKTSSLRSFFGYLVNILQVLENNPTDKLESPKLESRTPNYLTLAEAQRLLQAVQSEKNNFYRIRDFCIITLFLNCGMRVSELISINTSMIRDDGTMSVIGKGNKERTIYLNNACESALSDYLAIRNDITADNSPLFLSNRNTRISRRSVERLVDKYLNKAGLDTNIYSTHKLRHTAATLMYKYGEVDIRALQDILGHRSVATTQIYTHVDNEQLRNAVASNPLSDVTIKESINTDVIKVESKHLQDK